MSTGSDRRGDAVRRGAEGVVGAASVGLAAADPVAGMLAALLQSQIADLLADLARRGISRVFHVTFAETDLSPEQLIHQLAASDDGLRLLARTVEVARTAAHDEKLRALGRCLAAGADDDARIDQELLLVSAVAALESEDMRLLRNLAERGIDDHDHGTSDQSIAGRLVGQGVAVTVPTYGVASFRITRLGLLLLDRARAADPAG